MKTITLLTDPSLGFFTVTQEDLDKVLPHHLQQSFRDSSNNPYQHCLNLDDKCYYLAKTEIVDMLYSLEDVNVVLNPVSN